LILFSRGQLNVFHSIKHNLWMGQMQANQGFLGDSQNLASIA
jgi:hypothetical protein